MGGFYYAIYFLYSAVATVDHFKINSAKIVFFFFYWSAAAFFFYVKIFVGFWDRTVFCHSG